MSRRIQVTFTDAQWRIIQSLKGEFGDSDSDVVRSIVLAWLTEKSILTANVKKRILGEGHENLP